ncbi:hypothetical protein BDN70DRAFT_990738 [Pholiota conissans]|uniref:F-box domain-containing protein n=1 Tax=Pholiota conissans TaxID=109636 RepID=A0A9P5Z7N5_9AGAR|nr:hypothetical protein BDN70DRAFT_990738 [Pholiota conissans]
MARKIPPCPRKARSLSRSACNEIALIYQKICDLTKERLSACHRANREHDPLISNLPNEIVAKIFTHFSEISDNTDGVFINRYFVPVGNRKKRIIATPMLLGAVCTAWRDIAWSTPQLWNFIPINLAENVSLGFVRKWLARSGELPLYLDIYILNAHPGKKPLQEKVLELFASYASRWFSLTLSIQNPTLLQHLFCEGKDPLLLHNLKIDGDVSTGIHLGRTPNLREIIIYNSLNIFKLLHLDFGKVTVLKCVFTSIDDALQVFLNLSSLTHFTFHFENEYAELQTVQHTYIEHHSLAFLYIKLWSKPMNTTISWLKLPALQYLVLDSRLLGNVVDIAGLVKRSSCAIKILEVSVSESKLHYSLSPPLLPQGYEPILEVLQNIPSIETLEFSSSYLCFGILLDPLLIMLSNTASTLDFLPNLKSLRMIQIPFTHKCLIDMIQAHLTVSQILATSAMEVSQPGRPLCLLHVDIGHKSHRKMDESMKEEISKYVTLANAAGFKITFNS